MFPSVHKRGLRHNSYPCAGNAMLHGCHCPLSVQSRSMDNEFEYLHPISFAIPSFEISESAISKVVQYSNPTDSKTSFFSQLIGVRLPRLFSDGPHYEFWALSPSTSEPWFAYEFPVRREPRSFNSSNLSNDPIVPRSSRI